MAGSRLKILGKITLRFILPNEETALSEVYISENGIPITWIGIRNLKDLEIIDNNWPKVCKKITGLNEVKVKKDTQKEWMH